MLLGSPEFQFTKAPLTAVSPLEKVTPEYSHTQFVSVTSRPASHVEAEPPSACRAAVAAAFSAAEWISGSRPPLASQYAFASDQLRRVASKDHLERGGLEDEDEFVKYI